MQVIDSSIVNVALPDMMGNLGASLDEIAWVSTGYILASVIVIPLTGWLGSMFGRKRYFVGSIILFTLASFFCGASHSLGTLIFWRIVQGIGGGALMTVSQAVLFEAFPREEAGMAMALFGLGVMVGRRSVRRWAAGSRTTMAGRGSSTSTCRLASSPR